MKISSQIKLTKDAYAGFYSCGLTMLDSKTMDRFGLQSESLEKTIYTSSDGLELQVEHIQDEATGATYISTSMTNNGSDAVTLEMIDSFVVSGIVGDKIHRFLSFWSAEGRHKVDDIRDINMEPSWNYMAYRVEKFGNVGSMPVRKYFPFVAIEDSTTGQFTAFQLYSPASWQIEIVIREDETITVAGGIADRDYGHFTKTINPGESMNTPKACMAVGNSLYDVCDKLVKAQHPDISPVDNDMGITFNEYCTTWGNPTEENMLRICDRLEGEGIKYLVMDAGWFIEGDGYWWEVTGSWDYGPSRFPNGLKPMADYIRSKGMIPGIWYEFENVSTKCPLYNKPEYLVMKDGVPLSVGDRRFLDMCNPDVINHLSKQVIDTLKDNGFGYIKVDYNDTMGMGCDGPDGIGENLRQKVLGTQSFFKKMKEAIPDLVIENCSSGGHRLEPSFMELASMASFSDAHEIVALPIIAASLQLLVKPEQNQIWSVLRATDSDARLYYSLCATLFGRMGLSGDIYTASDHQWDILRAGMNFYNNVSDIIKDGKTVLLHNTSRSNNKPTGGQLVVRILESGSCDKTKRRSLVVYHRFEDSVSIREFIDSVGDVDGIDGITAGILDNAHSFGLADIDYSAQAWVI